MGDFPAGHVSWLKGWSSFVIAQGYSLKPHADPCSLLLKYVQYHYCRCGKEKQHKDLSHAKYGKLLIVMNPTC